MVKAVCYVKKNNGIYKIYHTNPMSMVISFALFLHIVMKVAPTLFGHMQTICHIALNSENNLSY